jgi:hypothetical protein
MAARSRKTRAGGAGDGEAPAGAGASGAGARPGGKIGLMLALLGRPEGASLAELVAATGWRPHSVRGALAGSLKRKGHVIYAEKVGPERRYRIGGAA